ncbi:unnamed protein product [Moneuplotes crassus]|uniref:Uncharacterized protein n=1 Tax=Euplotes crassus TaxID=5936 RepID=A0AAD1X698_EUPCR|nr:unnamed protein product [Moneuplotes crassus]
MTELINKNTCMRSIAFTLCFVLMLACFTEAIDSQINFRIYRKTLQDIVDKNAPLISDYTKADLGTVDIGDITVEDAMLNIFTEENEFESSIKFIADEGFQLSIDDLLFELTGKVDGKDSVLRGDVESLFVKLSVKNSEKERDTSVRFDAGSLPQLDISDYSVKTKSETFKWTIGGEEKNDASLIKATSVWIDAAIQANMGMIKIIVNSAQTYVADYLTSTVDEDTFRGSLSFTKIIFNEEYAQLGLTSSFKDEGDEHFVERSDKDLPEVTDDENAAVQILFDENIINSGLHSAFHADGEFGLRDILGTEDPDNEYADMFKAVLLTNVIGQGWKEIQDEYGGSKRIDARCSFGKGLFKDLIKKLEPSKVRFLEGSEIDFTLGFGCSVVVEKEVGVWDPFRSFYAELYAKLSLGINSNDATKMLQFEGDVKDLKAKRIKIFKKSDPMVVEETTLTMMVNLGLGMAKSQAQTLLDIPQIGYPTIKRCTGLVLSNPSVVIEEGFVSLSTDLDVSPAQKGCDIFDNMGFNISREDHPTRSKAEEEHTDDL